MNKQSAPLTSLRLDIWTDEAGTVQVAVSTNSLTNWMGTEAQFYRLFCIGRPGNDKNLNVLCDALNLLWTNAKLQESRPDAALLTGPVLVPSFH